MAFLDLLMFTAVLVLPSALARAATKKMPDHFDPGMEVEKPPSTARIYARCSTGTMLRRFGNNLPR